MILILPSIWSVIPKGFKIPNAILASCDLADPLLGFFLVRYMQAMLAVPANLCRPNRDPFWLSQLETTASLASGRSDGSTMWQNNQLSQNACEGKLQITVHKSC